MVIEFLEKKSKEIADERNEIFENIENLNVVIAENAKFIEYLENSHDSNVDIFSPVVVSSSDDSRLEELKSEQENHINTLQNLQIKYNNLCQEYDESINVIEIVKKHYNLSKKIVDDNISDEELFNIRLLEAQEYEKQRIARELHDSSVQTMTSLVHKIELCTKLIEMDPIRCKLELMVMSKTLKDVIQEMRNMIYNLRPMSFDDIGLDVTIERALSDIETRGVVHTNYIVEGESPKIKQVVALTLLRVIQEACNNSLKYANATTITVKNIYTPTMIETFIEDDGCGFDVESYDSKIRDDNSGFGMNTMRERVYLLSGEIEIKSKIGEGTKIHIKIPIKEEKQK
ncbi:MAG: sensor histidine kinase [Lachnospiraceae bacterium]|nr:sensor histidine kinase [Lachnospiraceae bacterium]